MTLDDLLAQIRTREHDDDLDATMAAQIMLRRGVSIAVDADAVRARCVELLAAIILHESYASRTPLTYAKIRTQLSSTDDLGPICREMVALHNPSSASVRSLPINPAPIKRHPFVALAARRHLDLPGRERQAIAMELRRRLHQLPHAESA